MYWGRIEKRQADEVGRSITRLGREKGKVQAATPRSRPRNSTNIDTIVCRHIARGAKKIRAKFGEYWKEDAKPGIFRTFRDEKTRI